MKHFRMLAAGLCSAVLLCGFAIPAYALSLIHILTESMKNDIAVAQRLGITATTLEGILTVKGQGRR